MNLPMRLVVQTMTDGAVYHRVSIVVVTRRRGLDALLHNIEGSGTGTVGVQSQTVCSLRSSWERVMCVGGSPRRSAPSSRVVTLVWKKRESPLLVEGEAKNKLPQNVHKE